MSYLDEAGCTRVNLCAEDWRSPEDPRRFLDRRAAPVVLGDPISFDALDQVRLSQPPRALISSIATLSDPFARELSRRYGCPVLDVYALTEAGIVAVRTPQGHAILPHDVYVEVLDEHDEPCPPGVRGEVTLTGGRNPFAPLLRYRTGDLAALAWHQGRPVLQELEGRPPVVFPVPDGRVVHCMEVSRALRPYPLVQYRLHQDAGGAFRFGYQGGGDIDGVRSVLHDLLGASASLTIEALPAKSPGGRKVLQFQSALAVTGAAGGGARK